MPAVFELGGAGMKTNSGGITFGDALLLLFIGLKLSGCIDWSWWWVMSPVWIACLLVLLVAMAKEQA